MELYSTQKIDKENRFARPKVLFVDIELDHER